MPVNVELSSIVTPPIGLSHRERMIVARRHTVPNLDDTWPGFKDMPVVFATAMMCGFIEQTCIEAVRPYLTAAQRTVGTHLNVSHVAPTPIGLAVTAEVELLAVNGKRMEFRVRCSDETGVIGEGTHHRALVTMDEFCKRVLKKEKR